MKTQDFRRCFEINGYDAGQGQSLERTGIIEKNNHILKYEK